MPNSGIRQQSKGALFIVACFFLYSSLSFPAETLTPGVIGGLKTLINDSREKVLKEFQGLKAASKIELSPSLELVKSSKIDRQFMRSLFLHSEKRYLKMVSINQCHLYTLLENRLLKSSLGEIDFLIMRSQANKKFLIRYDHYVEQIYKFKCQKFSQFSKIFNRKNLKKTVSSVTFTAPKTEEQCTSLLADWTKNDYLPYLCKIPHVLSLSKRAQQIKSNQKKMSLGKASRVNQLIRDGDYYKKEISFFKRSYLKNICAGLQKKELFCNPYLTKDAWSMVLNGEMDVSSLKIRCNNLFNREPNASLSQNKLIQCADKLKNSKAICTTKGSTGFASLFPKPNCSLISTALQNARLYTPYQDCPGLIDNAAITNIHRILNHHLPSKLSSSQNSCQAESNYTLAKLNTDTNKKQKWPLEICYFDKIENKEKCTPYIPGTLPKSKLAEGKVVTEIVQKLTALSGSNKCRVISKSQYNPALLEYKNGCHIVFDQNNCSNAYCPKEVILNEKVISGLTYKGIAAFDYFPNNWKDAKKSSLHLMQETYKLKGKKILNLTALEVYLRKYPKAILHGIACAQDILPRFFKRKSFNECSPLPFIVDGLIRKNDNMVLVMRTSIDDIHSPRLVPWNWIFTGVMKYTSLHPLRQWNLYGIKK